MSIPLNEKLFLGGAVGFVAMPEDDKEESD